jgi:four helix bundle protein
MSFDRSSNNPYVSRQRARTRARARARESTDRYTDESKLDHENLDVYQCSVKFLAFSAKIANQIPKEYSGLSNQLRRASTSISLNIAEGSGKTPRADKAKFYGIARGSSMECGAVLDACNVLEFSEKALVKESKKLLVRIVAMLTKMCR